MAEETEQTAGELLLYGDIGESWWGESISAKSVADRLKEIGDVDVLNVRINSAGGSAFEGIAIYNQLVRAKPRIEIDIDGMALSIASVIAMAGAHIRMAENAMLMIHDPWTFAMGDAEDLRKTAELLDGMKDNLITTYARRTSIEREELADLMAEETWFNAAEAQERGFVDEVTAGQAAENAAARAKLTRVQARRFRHPPKNLVEHGRRVLSIAAKAGAERVAQAAGRQKIVSIVESARRLRQGQA
jgi:ATP-dependent Clp protease protease subunit